MGGNEAFVCLTKLEFDCICKLNSPFDCDGGKFYQGFGATYLENTSECTPEDVRKMEIWKDKVYILVKDKLVRYNVRQGKEELCYNNPQDYSVKSFDLDTLKQVLSWIIAHNLFVCNLKVTKNIPINQLINRQIWII